MGTGDLANRVADGTVVYNWVQSFGNEARGLTFRFRMFFALLGQEVSVSFGELRRIAQEEKACSSGIFTEPASFCSSSGGDAAGKQIWTCIPPGDCGTTRREYLGWPPRASALPAQGGLSPGPFRGLVSFTSATSLCRHRAAGSGRSLPGPPPSSVVQRNRLLLATCS